MKVTLIRQELHLLPHLRAQPCRQRTKRYEMLVRVQCMILSLDRYMVLGVYTKVYSDALNSLRRLRKAGKETFLVSAVHDENCPISLSIYILN